MKVGDVVLFKTGGPRMTVVKLHKKDMVTCAFFIGDALNTVKIPIASLEEVGKITYDEIDALSSEFPVPFSDRVQQRDDEDISGITDENTLKVLEKYIAEDQPAVLAKLEGRDITLEDSMAEYDRANSTVENLIEDSNGQA